MTSDLQHGPVTADMLPKLTPGRSVVSVSRAKASEGFSLLLVEEVDASVGEVRIDGWWACEDLTYLGEYESDAPDAFILAPEGGWRSNPVPGMRVDTVAPGADHVDCVSDNVPWKAVTKFRLARPAEQPAPDVREAVRRVIEPLTESVARGFSVAERRALADKKINAILALIEAERAKVREALRDYDAAVATCPVRENAPLQAGRERCLSCGATSSQSCGHDASASYAFIKAVRAALSDGGE